MKNKIKYVLLTLLSLLLILAISFYVWAKSGYNAINEVNDILNDKTDNIIVSEKKDYISFRPKNADIEKGFILYPGSRVESSSYSMLCRDIAKNNNNSQYNKENPSI